MAYISASLHMEWGQWVTSWPSLSSPQSIRSPTSATSALTISTSNPLPQPTPTCTSSILGVIISTFLAIAKVSHDIKTWKWWIEFFRTGSCSGRGDTPPSLIFLIISARSCLCFISLLFFFSGFLMFYMLMTVKLENVIQKKNKTKKRLLAKVKTFRDENSIKKAKFLWPFVFFTTLRFHICEFSLALTSPTENVTVNPLYMPWIVVDTHNKFIHCCIIQSPLWCLTHALMTEMFAPTCLQDLQICVFFFSCLILTFVSGCVVKLQPRFFFFFFVEQPQLIKTPPQSDECILLPWTSASNVSPKNHSLVSLLPPRGKVALLDI